MPLFKATGHVEYRYCGCCSGDEQEINIENEFSTKEDFINYLRSVYVSYSCEKGASFYFEENEAQEVIDEEKRIYSIFDLPDFSSEPGYEEALVIAREVAQEKKEAEEAEKKRLQKEKDDFESKIKKSENKANELFEYFRLRFKFDKVPIPFDDTRLEWMGFVFRFERFYDLALEQGKNLTSFTISDKEIFRLSGFGNKLRCDQQFGKSDFGGDYFRYPGKDQPYARFSPEKKDINENYFGIPVYLSEDLHTNEVVVGYDEFIPPVTKNQRHSTSFTIKL